MSNADAEPEREPQSYPSADIEYGDLIDRASVTDQPVTDVEAQGHRRRVHGATTDRGTVVRATISWHDQLSEEPDVSFYRCYPASDVRSIRDWSAFGAGGLNSPHTLEAWVTMMAAFQAAHERYERVMADA